jgi:hypothetical protein
MPPRRVWNGSDDLRRSLVAVDQLQPHPRNPRRREQVQDLRDSLRRFGQQRSIVALPDGTIVAGNHTYRAAVEEGWTHIAVTRSDLTEDEVDAYLVADNQLARVGGYDDTVLGPLLAAVAERQQGLAGTGFNADDLDAVLASVAQRQGATPETGNGGRQGISRDMVEVVLLYSVTQRDEVAGWLEAIAVAKGVDGVSQAVYEAARDTYDRL